MATQRNSQLGKKTTLGNATLILAAKDNQLAKVHLILLSVTCVLEVAHSWPTSGLESLPRANLVARFLQWCLGTEGFLDAGYHYPAGT